MKVFKRTCAVVLSMAMIITSSTFGGTGVYASEGDIQLGGSDDQLLLLEDTQSDETGDRAILEESNDNSADSSGDNLSGGEIISEDNSVINIDSSDEGSVPVEDTDSDKKDSKEELSIEVKEYLDGGDTVIGNTLSDNTLSGNDLNDGEDEQEENHESIPQTIAINDDKYHYDVRVGDFYFDIYDGTHFAILREWAPKSPQEEMNVTIPDEIDLKKDCKGYNSGLLDDNYKRKVVGINGLAFAEGETHRLKSVVIPASVRVIGSGAFMNCALLTSIEFPESMVTTAKDVYGDGLIGAAAFAGCTSLEDVTLPKKLDTIGAGVFTGCTSLNSIEVPSGWGTTAVLKDGKKYSMAEGTEVNGPFSGCESLATITFADETSEIAEGMLANCDSIESIIIPDKVTTIGAKAFYGCDNLKSAVLNSGSSLVEIGDWAFQKNASLKSANLPKYTKKIGQGAFLDCVTLTETTIPISIGTIGDKAYYNCVELANVTFRGGDPQNITGGTIGKYAFGDDIYNANTKTFKHPLKKIQSLSIPNSIVEINEGAFMGCTGLTKLTFEDSYPFTEGQKINKKAFFGCTSMEEVQYSGNLVLIGLSAFEECTSLATVAFGDKPDTLDDTLEIGNRAFYNDSAITRVTFTANLESIGENAFENCSSLATLTLPNSNTTIGKAAFKECTSLVDLKLSEKLETIGEQAFMNCESLRQLIIPMSIKTVNTSVSSEKVEDKDKEKGVFYGTHLTDVEFKRYNTDDLYRIPDKILLGATWVQNVTMDEETTEIGSFAFAICTALKEIHIPESVVSIDGGAFAMCSRLGESFEDDKEGTNTNVLVIPGKVTSIGRSAFKYCTALEKIQLPDSLETLGRGKGDGAFESCTSLKEISIPDKVTEIGEATFASCENLEKVKLPVGITKIDNNLFAGCMALAEVKNVSKDYLEEIGTSSFEGCATITSFNNSGSIDFSEYSKLKKIGDRAFYGCDSVTALTLSAATESIGASSFENCRGLVTVSIGTGLKEIPVNAFANDPKLKSSAPADATEPKGIIIPRNVKTLRTGSFSKDISLEDIHIPKETTIEADAFSYHGKMTIWGYVPSPAKDYADENDIKFEAEAIYADSIEFTDNTELVLNVNAQRDVPGVNVKPVHYSVDVDYSSSDPNIFTVEEYKDEKTKEVRNRITAKGEGVAKLIAQVPGDAGGSMKRAYLDVRVKKFVQSVTMAAGMKKDNSINMPDTLQLAVVVTPADATDPTYKWVSEDENVCYVNQEGLVLSKGVGNTRVAAISNDDPTKMCVFNIEVTNSPIKKAKPDWAKGIGSPRMSDYSGTTAAVVYGTKLALTCDTPGAQIYYTVDGSSAPMADYEGHMDEATMLYSSPIVIDSDTFGAEAVKSGKVHIKAMSVCEGYQYSGVVDFAITVNGWGEIDGTKKQALFQGDYTKVPQSVWYTFEDDDTIYRPMDTPQITKVNKEYTGKKIYFDDEIYVYYGFERLVEGRDYKVGYNYNIEPSQASLQPTSPSVTIKGMGEYYKGSSEFRFTINKATVSEVQVKCSNKEPEYTGRKFTPAQLGVELFDKDNKKLTLGQDYTFDETQTKATGTFVFKFNLIGNYEGSVVSDPITVKPYDVKKHIKNGDSKIFIEPLKAAEFKKTGAIPKISVKFDGNELKEGVDYKVTYGKNKKINKNAKAKIKFMGYFKGNVTEYFEIAQKDVSVLTVYAEDIKYNGKAGGFKVLPSILDDGKALSRRKDIEKYTTTNGCKYYYASGDDVGKEIPDNATVEDGQIIKVSVTVKAKANGAYKGEKELSAYYRVYGADKNIKKASVSPSPVVIDYNEGKEVIPVNKTDFTLTMPGATEPLTSNDFEIVSVTRNRFVGTATVQVRGKNGYGGTKTFRIKIVKRKM